MIVSRIRCDLTWKTMYARGRVEDRVITFTADKSGWPREIQKDDLSQRLQRTIIVMRKKNNSQFLTPRTPKGMEVNVLVARQLREKTNNFQEGILIREEN